MTVTGVPGTPAITVTTTLFGPYSIRSPSCRPTAADGSSKESPRAGKATWSSTRPPSTSTKRGYYAWQAETSIGDTWLGSRSPCLAANTTTFVS